MTLVCACSTPFGLLVHDFHSVNVVRRNHNIIIVLLKELNNDISLIYIVGTTLYSIHLHCMRVEADNLHGQIPLNVNE